MSNSEKRLITGQDFEREVVPLIQGARERIDICMYQWQWSDLAVPGAIGALNRALLGAQGRGVRVRAIVEEESTRDILIQAGMKAKCIRTAGVMHLKVILIDEKTAIYGSHNLTKRAMNGNVEMSMLHQYESRDNLIADYIMMLWQ